MNNNVYQTLTQNLSVESNTQYNIGSFLGNDTPTTYGFSHSISVNGASIVILSSYPRGSTSADFSEVNRYTLRVYMKPQLKFLIKSVEVVLD